MTAPGGGERRREPLVGGVTDNHDLTTPEVMQATAIDAATAWRTDARPDFTDLLDATAVDPDEETT